jgi:hypothetical protein
VGPSGQKFIVEINKFSLFEIFESIALKCLFMKHEYFLVGTETLIKETSGCYETLISNYYHTSLRNVLDDPKFGLPLFC